MVITSALLCDMKRQYEKSSLLRLATGRLPSWLRVLITVVVLADMVVLQAVGFLLFNTRKITLLSSIAEENVNKRYHASSHHEDQPSSVFQSLDLHQVLERIVVYCGTFRGKRALLSLAAEKRSDQRDIRFRNEKTRMSRRQQQLRFDWGTATTQRNDDKPNRWTRPFFTCSPAKSAEEARLMHEKVRLAITLIDKNYIPPLYPNGGIFDTADNRIDTDDDEWIELSPDQYTLENILQAEQIVKRIVKVIQWAQANNTPGVLANAILDITTMTMNLDRWETIQLELQGAVEIRRVRTALDPTGRSSYQFGLSEMKFPILKVLRERETFLRQQQQQQQIHSKDQVKREKLLRELGEEIEEKEKEIQTGLTQILYSNAKHIDVFLDCIAEVDVIFAKAAYGIANGADYHVTIGNDQCINVPHFVHPLLAESAVPVDLRLRQNSKALVISGSNGGGKTTVLKSFGLAIILAKLGIPIFTKSSDAALRIDFFDKILVNIGDYQNLINHQSTYTAQLSRYVDVLEHVSTNKNQSFLVLLDELGSGTEEQAGGAIGQAILEQLLEYDNCKIVATTHSPLLKTLSFVSDRIDCASVLLSRRHNQQDQDSVAIATYQLPSFQLQYGCIGQSNALGAASQILPQVVLERASEILNDNGQSTENMTIVNGRDFRSIAYMRALTESLEFKLDCAEKYLVETERRAGDSRSIEKAMISLASAYDDHLSRLEQRVESCFQTIKKGGSNDSLQLLGDTLVELRVVRTKIKTETELLRERGLQRIPLDLELSVGTVVVVACTDEECSKWDGMTGKVASPPSSYHYDHDSVTNGAVWVSLSMAFGGDDVPLSERVLLFQRHQLAIWDYNSVWEDEKSIENDVARSIPEARERLTNLLSTLSSPNKEKKQTKPNSNFLSSRERKASKRQKRK